MILTYKSALQLHYLQRTLFLCFRQETLPATAEFLFSKQKHNKKKLCIL